MFQVTLNKVNVLLTYFTILGNKKLPCKKVSTPYWIMARLICPPVLIDITTSRDLNKISIMQFYKLHYWINSTTEILKEHYLHFNYTLKL